MGTDCKSAAFSFGGSNPPAPTKDSSIRTGYWSFCFICLAKGAARVDSNSIDPPNSPAGESPCATATTAASGRNREELLGLRPAGCACRPRHDAAAGSRDPGSFSARLATSTRAHPKTATYQNTLRFCFTILFPAVSASPSHQSSCARILFCTISPAGVRARVRPSKVAYPARTQFCTKASCAVENCLPYRAL